MIRKKEILLMGLIISIQIIIIIAWGYHRENYYWDEYFTFERAHYAADSTEDDHHFQYDKEFSTNKWIDSEVVRETLVVSEKDSVINDGFPTIVKKLFKVNSYSVLLNLFSYLLTPGQISKWPSIALNILLFLFNQIVLFFLAVRVTKKKNVAFATIAMYGFSGICISMTTFVRFYMLATLMVTLFTYFHCLYWSDNNGIIRKYLYLILSLACIWVGHNNAQFTIFYAAFFIFFFSIMIYAKKGLREALIYCIPLFVPAMLFFLFFTNYWQILSHLNEFRNDDGALGYFIGTILDLRISDIPSRIAGFFALFGNYFFGNNILFTLLLLIVFIVFLLQHFIKKNRPKDEINDYSCIVFSVVMFFAMFIALNIFVILRYISFVVPELTLILVIWYFVTFGDSKKTTLIFASIVLLQCLLVNFTGKVDMVYSGDGKQIELIKQQNVDYIVMDNDYTIPFGIYQSVLMLDDDGKILVYDKEKKHELTDELKDEMLVLVMSENADIYQRLVEEKYSLDYVGATYYYQVYLAKK